MEPSSRQAIEPVNPLSRQAHSKGESQPTGEHNDHEWRWMRRQGHKALPLPQRKRSGQGDHSLLGPQLRCLVPMPWPVLLPTLLPSFDNHTVVCR
jgi:hypothetical protein